MKTVSLLLITSLFINGVFGDEVKSVSVMEGDSVTLHPDITDIQTADDVIVTWTFGSQSTMIAQINRAAKKILINDDGLDGKFKNRLKLNNQTGDLTITNITTQHTGDYNVRIKVGKNITSKNFKVNSLVGAGGVKSVSLLEGDSVTLLIDDPDIKKYDVILWRFQHGNSPLAELNRNTAIFSTYDDVHDGIFRDNLQLDVQIGSLTIRHVRTKHSGLYEVDISNTSSSYTIHQSFTVSVGDKVKSVSVIVGDSVILQTQLTDIQRDDLIKWWFIHDDSLIAQIYKLNKLSRTYDGEEGRFRGRLKLNNQTGDLTITDSKTEHTGLYEVKMSDRRRSIQRRFSVHVSEQQGQSPGAVAGICVSIILLAAAAAAVGVIYYRRKIAELNETERLQVKEESSVNLKTKVTDIQRVEKIEWWFIGTLIAEINPANNIFKTYDGLFRDELNLNRQTGDLTINDIKWQHDGVYLLKIIRDKKTSYKRFRVHVIGEIRPLQVNEGASVHLKTEVKNIKKDDLIEWRFRETLIAKINPANNIFRTYDGDDDLFRDKLKLNRQTGDLTISDSRTKHYGIYTLKLFRGGKASERRFIVYVIGNKEKLLETVGYSANLETDLTDIQRVEKIEWRFGNKEILIAEINPANNIISTYNGDDDLFRHKLKLNHQTGDLNINDIRWEHEGVYLLKIIRDGETSYKTISVSVKSSRGGGPGETEMQPFLPNNSDLPPV